MRNAYEVLQQKEAELARIRHEITSLRIVAPLLADEVQSKDSQALEDAEDDHEDASSEATGTDGLPSFSATKPRIWNVLRRGK